MLKPAGEPTARDWAVRAGLTAVLVLVCVRYLDLPLARLVQSHLYVDSGWAEVTSDLPDLLLQLVLFTTTVSLVLYRVRLGRGQQGALTQLARQLAWTGPAAYLAKALLKLVFGRINTRVWLEQPTQHGFYWFQHRQGCEGFPSGHMMVVVALMSALCRYYPAWRPCCIIVGFLLGVALIATDYHFLADVVAGIFFGVLVETGVWFAVQRAVRVSRGPAS
jgi:membrane-associated phospholipid phosphatase